jgi:hypothetical protein
MIIVFAGPSLPADARPQDPQLVWAPPAAQGDVYRATLLQPRAIALIDGFFSWTPAVWHKEILWAIRQRIRVYGSSSMGALRAAELHAFGMVGVGKVFEGFASGALEDDDEVALVHAGADAGFRPFSIPMVNLRATLEKACHAGRIDPETAGELVARAKAMHYPERTWASLLEGRPLAQDIENWLHANLVDVKRADALRLLDRVRADAGLHAPEPAFHFERTALWEELVQTAGAAAPKAGEDDTASEPMTAEDARRRLARRGADLDGVERRAVLRFLAADHVADLADDLDEVELEREIVAFRRRRGLLEEAQLTAWLTANDLSPRSFVALVLREALLERYLHQARGAASPHLLDELRVDGRYAELRREVYDAQAG